MIIKQDSKTKYEKSLFYQINSSAKYFDLLFSQIFKKIDIGISASEHLALAIVIETKECCQRDLAKIILKDRANTGKLALKLQELDLIKIEVKTKNNKPVKILSATKKGKEIHKKIIQKLEPTIKHIKEQVSQNTIDETIKNLIDFKEIVKKAVKTNI